MCLCAAGLPLAANAGDELSSSNALSIADFQNLVSERALVIKSFRIEGTVCAVVRTRKLLALQDKTAAVLLELPSIEEAIGAGDQVAVEGTRCSLIRSPFGIRVGTAPVVDHDGFRILETSAIAPYLDEVLPGPSFMPDNAKDRARMRMAIGIIDSYGYDALVGVAGYHLFPDFIGGKNEESRSTLAPSRSAKGPDPTARRII